LGIRGKYNLLLGTNKFLKIEVLLAISLLVGQRLFESFSKFGEMVNMWKKILVILFVFVGFYLAAHFYIRWKNTVTDNVTKLGKLIPCEPNEVDSFEFGSTTGALQEVRRVDQKKSGEPPAIQFENSEWKLVGTPTMEADQVITTAIVSGACEIYDPIPTKESEFSEAGTAIKKLVVRISKSGKLDTWGLDYISSAANRVVYLKATDPSGDIKYYKTQTKLLPLISLSVKEMANLRFMRMLADNINKVTVNVKGREEFSMERNGDHWDIFQAGKKLGKGSEESVKFVNRFTTLKALSADYDQLNPSMCDPKIAKASVILEGIANKKEILAFDYEKNGPIRACNSEREAVFTIHKDFATYLNVGVEKLLAK
jgi:hypothetical protein